MYGETHQQYELSRDLYNVYVYVYDYVYVYVYTNQQHYMWFCLKLGYTQKMLI